MTGRPKSKPPRASWTLTARLLHWLMAALIIAQAALGWYAGSLDRSPWRIDMMTAHKSLGITLLALLLFRLAWRTTHPAPPAPAGTPGFAIRLAGWTHGALYLLMLAVPLTGWLSASASVFPWKFWWLFIWPRIAAPDQALHDLASSLHGVLVWVLAALLLLHITAALKHHLLDRDDVLRSMWNGR